MPLTAENADVVIIPYKEKGKQNELFLVLLVFSLRTRFSFCSLCLLVDRGVSVAANSKLPLGFELTKVQFGHPVHFLLLSPPLPSPSLALFDPLPCHACLRARLNTALD